MPLPPMDFAAEPSQLLDHVTFCGFLERGAGGGRNNNLLRFTYRFGVFDRVNLFCQ